MTGIMIMIDSTDSLYLEETEGCDSERQTIPFKFKYFFSKDPCKGRRCLVKAACNRTCELKFIYWDQTHSVKDWKRRFPNFIKNTLNFSMTVFIVSVILFLLLMANGCSHVNQERAVKYYDQHVKHFPEEG